MKIKAENPAGLLEGKDVPVLVRAYCELNHLKQLYRQGWLRRGVSEAECETVAEHSFAVAILVIWLVQADYPELDLCRAIQMALIHDLGEIYAGDIVPADKIAAAEKRRLETVSIQRLFAGLPGGLVYQELWEDFEKGESPEARLVRQLDRLEMGLQAGIYRLQGKGGMQEFIDSARMALNDPRLVELLDSLAKIDDGVI